MPVVTADDIELNMIRHPRHARGKAVTDRNVHGVWRSMPALFASRRENHVGSVRGVAQIKGFSDSRITDEWSVQGPALDYRVVRRRGTVDDR